MLDSLIEARLVDCNRELRGHLLRDVFLLVGKRPDFATEADRSDELTTRDHRHNHVDVDARSEQRIDFRSGRWCVGMYSLRLASFHPAHVAHQPYRVAHAPPDMNPATARRCQPL